MNLEKFKSFSSWIKESKDKTDDNVWENIESNGITVLYPGGFKPMTGGHLNLIKKYSDIKDVKEIQVLVGPGIRNGIDQNLAIQIAKKITQTIPKVRIIKSEYPSPILTAYKIIESAKPGNYALAASSKDDDYKRVRNFTDQHQIGGKYYNGIPKNVRILELPVNVNPTIFNGRNDELNKLPISASILRNDILNMDFKNFSKGYPTIKLNEISSIWNMLVDKITESFNFNNLIKLNEGVVSNVNKHMTHAEDLVLLGGIEGLNWVINMIENLYNELKGNTPKNEMQLSVKIDGAPAIFAWSKFNGLPDNGISMKGLFAKIPKVYTTAAEIDDFFIDRPNLAYKLKTFLKHFKNIKIPEQEIWQGDFLFDNKSIQKTEIKGKSYYAFHPNTIYYVVPEKSDIGKLISKADVGITWHTRYVGNDLKNIQANYDVKISNLKLIDKILMTDPYIKSFAGIINFSIEESKYIEKTIIDLKSYSNSLGKNNKYKNAILNKDLITLFMIFQNTLIKQNIDINDPDIFMIKFKEFLKERSIKEVEKRKTETGQERVIQKFAILIDELELNEDEWWLMVHMINEITILKELFIKKLNNIGSFQTYLKMKDGNLKLTNQEGFAVSDINANIVKLVDRKEFSWSNFSPEIKKGWENES